MKAGDFCNQNAGYGSMCARVGAYCPSCDRMQTCAISEHSHFVNDRIALRCEECRHIWIISRFDDVTPTVDHFRGSLVRLKRELVRLAGGPCDQQVTAVIANQPHLLIIDPGNRHHYLDSGHRDTEGRRIFAYVARPGSSLCGTCGEALATCLNSHPGIVTSASADSDLDV